MTNLVYLDYAATAPLRPEVAAEVANVQKQTQGIGLNPSSLHAAGRIARELLEDARARIAHALGADAAEIIFTSGGTEADALFVRGLDGPIAYSAIEHPAVARNIAAGREIPVDSYGRVELDALARIVAEQPDLAAVTVLGVGNETGVIEPLAQIRETVLANSTAEKPPLLHADMIQAVGKVPVDFHASGFDAMSLTAHKLGGPQGIGVLIVKRDVALRSDRAGGGQERELRSGTQNVLGAVGMAKAVEIAVAERESEQQRLAQLREFFLTRLHGLGLEIRETVPTEYAIPGIIHLLIPGASVEPLLFMLDSMGICVSAGSACHAGVARPSAAVLAMGYTETLAGEVLRLSLGYGSKRADLEALLEALPQAVAGARAWGNRK